ncbi:MAG: carbohydrate kinase family protein [Candidatus Dojkabacteria bacterium]|nr:carbohydrate kinase family protein [Candidatus Dojkabacteria bacterium]
MKKIKNKEKKENKKMCLAIGEVVIDEIILLYDEIILSQKIEKADHQISIGGPSCAGAVYWRNAGFDVTFITSLGNDSDSKFIIDYLDSKRINLIINRSLKTQKNHVIVELKNGRRTIIRDKIEKTQININNKLIESIKSADIIYLDRHYNYLIETILKHKKSNSILIFDPSTDASELNIKILSQIEHPIVPWEFVVNFYNNAKLSLYEMLIEFYKYLNKTYIVTLGEYGSLIVEESGCILFPSYKIEKCIDTCGAGDIFRASFGHSLLEGKNIYEAIDFANKVAALQCTRIGNVNAIPSLEDIKNTNLQKNYYNKEEILLKLKL